MNFDNRKYGKELLEFLLTAQEQAFEAGFEAGRAAQLEEQIAPPPHTPFSPQRETIEGAKTLLRNVGSTLLVGWMFQFFIPFLEDWPTALVILEIVRGPLKVGGDFAYTASLSRTAKEQISLRARLRFTFLFSAVLAFFAVGTSLLTQVGSSLILQLARELPIEIAVSWYDLAAAGLLSFTVGCAATYAQGFCIVPWVRNNAAERKRVSWLTTTRSYTRMATNYLLLFSLATLLAKFTR